MKATEGSLFHSLLPSLSLPFSIRTKKRGFRVLHRTLNPYLSFVKSMQLLLHEFVDRNFTEC
jgi:hypothetical protein